MITHRIAADALASRERHRTLGDLHSGGGWSGREADASVVGGSWPTCTALFIAIPRSGLDLIVGGEVFRDDDGFPVAQSAANDDLLDVQTGRLDGLDPRTVGGGATTYYAVTLGAAFKAADDLLIQAEVRADFAGSTSPFNDSEDDMMLTLGVSMLWRF